MQFIVRLSSGNNEMAECKTESPELQQKELTEEELGDLFAAEDKAVDIIQTERQTTGENCTDCDAMEQGSGVEDEEGESLVGEAGRRIMAIEQCDSKSGNMTQSTFESDEEGLLDGSISDFISSDDDVEEGGDDYLIAAESARKLSAGKQPEEMSETRSTEDEDTGEKFGEDSQEYNKITGIIKATETEKSDSTKTLPTTKQSSKASLTRENSSVTFANPIVKSPITTITTVDKTPLVSRDNTITEAPLPKKSHAIPLSDSTLTNNIHSPLSRDPSNMTSAGSHSTGGKKHKKNLMGHLPEMETAVEIYSNDWGNGDVEKI